MSAVFYFRTAWECVRCHRICAPHMDHCDCGPTSVVFFPSPITITPIPAEPSGPVEHPVEPSTTIPPDLT